MASNGTQSSFPTSAFDQRSNLAFQLKSGSYVSPRLTNNTYILDLSRPVLIKIIQFLADTDQPKDRLPFVLLPLFETCRELRYLASKFLPTDALWQEYIQTRAIKQKRDDRFCAYFTSFESRYDERDGFRIAPSPKLTECRLGTCASFHRMTAWYNLAGSNLKSFKLGFNFARFPIQDAYFLLLRLASSLPSLQQLDLGEYTGEQLEKTMKFCEGLSQLIPVVAPTLRTIIINTQLIHFIQCLCTYPLSHITTVHLILGRTELSCEIEIGVAFLRHLHDSNSQVKSLIVDGCGSSFVYLNNLLIHCPFLRTLELNLNRTLRNVDKQLRLSTLEKLRFSAVTRLTIVSANSGKEEMIKIAECVWNNEHITELQLKSCQTDSLSEVLKIYKESFGKKLTVLDNGCGISDMYLRNNRFMWDSSLIKNLEKYCINLKVLKVRIIDYSEVIYLAGILRKSKNLKQFTVFSNKLFSFNPTDTNELMQGLKATHSRLELICIGNVEIPITGALELMKNFSYSLKSFRTIGLPFSNTLYLSYLSRNTLILQLCEVLEYVLKNMDEFPHLRELRIPVECLLYGTIDLPEGRVAMHRLLELLKVMLKRFNNQEEFHIIIDTIKRIFDTLYQRS